MKTLIIYLTIITAVGVGSIAYMNHSINQHLEAQGCGLDTIRACDSLDSVMNSTTLKVTTSEAMQPYGESPEDEYTATMALEPTYQPQVTRHGYLIQETDDSNKLQPTRL